MSEPSEGDVQRDGGEQLVVLDLAAILQRHGLAVRVDGSDGGPVTLFIGRQQSRYFLPNGARAALLLGKET